MLLVFKRAKRVSDMFIDFVKSMDVIDDEDQEECMILSFYLFKSLIKYYLIIYLRFRYVRLGSKNVWTQC